MGNDYWELFCLEHGIKNDGTIGERSDDEALDDHSFFEESTDSTYSPRALFVDMEPSAIGECIIGISGHQKCPSAITEL